MDYAALYQKKLTSAAEAVKVVKSGDWVDYGWCTNHPYTLDKALAARQHELKDIKVRGGVTMWMPEICKAEDAGEHFTWNSWHCSGIDRKIISKGMGYFIPMRYSELPRFYRDGNATVDVAMIQVTPMDKHGNFSYALACSHLADMLDAAKTVIVEVNENLPWVYGLNGCEINIKDVDMVVEGENPPVAQLGAGGAPTEVDTAVANLVVPEIPNGACLQLGIGGMPNTIGSFTPRCMWTALWIWRWPARSPASTSSSTRAVRSLPSPPARRSSMTTWIAIPMSWVRRSTIRTTCLSSLRSTTSSPSTTPSTATCSVR